MTGVVGRFRELATIWLTLLTSSAVTPYSLPGSVRGPVRGCEGSSRDAGGADGRGGVVARAFPPGVGAQAPRQVTNAAAAASRAATASPRMVIMFSRLVADARPAGACGDGTGRARSRGQPGSPVGATKV